MRVLTVFDALSRYSPVVDPRFSHRAEDVINTCCWRWRPRADAELDAARAEFKVLCADAAALSAATAVDAEAAD